MIRLLAAAAGAVTVSAPAFGQEASAGIDLVSQYMFRGIAQTDGDPTVQGYAQAGLGPLSAGIWASGVDFGDGTSAEIDYTLAWSLPALVVDLDLGVIHYSYSGGPEDQDFTEVFAAVEKAALGWSFGGALHYSPEFYLATGEALYVAAQAERALGEAWSVGLTAGSTRFLDGGFSNQDYEDAGASLSRSFGPVSLSGTVTRTFGLEEDATEAFVTLGVALP